MDTKGIRGPVRAVGLGLAPGAGFSLLVGEKRIGELSFFSSFGGEIVIAGHRHRVHRDGYEHGPLMLERDDKLVATASPPTLYSVTFKVRTAHDVYTAEEDSKRRGRYTLLKGDGAIGAIRSRGIVGSQVTLELDQELPVLLQAFLLFLVVFFEKGVDDQDASEFAVD